MSLVSKFLRKYHGGYSHWCAGCEAMHPIAVEIPLSNGAKWTFDGSVEAPTFNPSINISVGPWKDGHIERCHYYLKNGELEYLGDCTHKLAGQKVRLPEIPKYLQAYEDDTK